MEVEIISKQLIKPSSPTPDRLRYLQLSFLDQWQAQFALSLVFFYPKSSRFSNTERCSILKSSLSETLTLFYPLAGRVRHNSYVDCNDEGVLFFKAKAKCQLSTILSDSNAYINKNLIPRGPGEVGDLAALFQFTLFDCGGIAISMSMSHKLGDAVSHFLFIKSWVAIANGNTDIKPPRFGFSTLFPPLHVPYFEQTISEEKLVTKFFAFSASAIAALKAKYAANYGKKLSRVEALSVFIWSRFMASTQTKDCDKKRYKVFQWVNLRPRMQLPDSNIHIGNLVTVVEAEANMNDTSDECYGIVKRMKDSLRNIDSTYVSKLRNSEQHLKLLNSMVREDVVCFDFSSVCNLSIYESDFGWGKTVFLGTCPHLFKNLVYFCDPKEGNGIDAWIGLQEDDMAKFEADNQLHAHLSSTRFSRM